MSSLVLKVNISSVEQIRRSLRAKLKGMARFRMQGGMKSVTDIDASLSQSLFYVHLHIQQTYFSHNLLHRRKKTHYSPPATQFKPAPIVVKTLFTRFSANAVANNIYRRN